jgi:hypothetical protein
VDVTPQQQWAGNLADSIEKRTRIRPARHVLARMTSLLYPAEPQFVDAYLVAEQFLVNGHIVVFTEDLVAVATVSKMRPMEDFRELSHEEAVVSVRVVPRSSLKAVDLPPVTGRWLRTVAPRGSWGPATSPSGRTAPPCRSSIPSSPSPIWSRPVSRPPASRSSSRRSCRIWPSSESREVSRSVSVSVLCVTCHVTANGRAVFAARRRPRCTRSEPGSSAVQGVGRSPKVSRGPPMGRRRRSSGPRFCPCRQLSDERT